MRAPLKFARGIDGISEFFGKAGVYITIAVIGVGFYNVAVRYLGRFVGLQLSSNFWIELQKYLFTAIFLAMFAYNLKHEVNVRVNFLYANWSLRRRALVNLIRHVVLSAAFLPAGHLGSLEPTGHVVATVGDVARSRRAPACAAADGRRTGLCAARPTGHNPGLQVRSRTAGRHLGRTGIGGGSNTGPSAGAGVSVRRAPWTIMDSSQRRENMSRGA